MEPCDNACPPRRSLNIGIQAYECLPGLVFVRVPNERGRWILTDRCVAEVDCEHCGAVAGEPCRRRNYFGAIASGYTYSVGTHCKRQAAGKQYRKIGPDGKAKPKLHVRTTDIDGAMSTEPENAD